MLALEPLGYAQLVPEVVGEAGEEVSDLRGPVAEKDGGHASQSGAAREWTNGPPWREEAFASGAILEPAGGGG